jgi:hypothetical protein
VIGQFARAIVSSEVASHQFKITTDKPNVKVSWQITGMGAPSADDEEDTGERCPAGGGIAEVGGAQVARHAAILPLPIRSSQEETS